MALNPALLVLKEFVIPLRPPGAVAVSRLTVPGVVCDLGDDGVTSVPLIGTLLSVKATLFGFELRWRLL
jgi:hypothetical protein